MIIPSRLEAAEDALLEVVMTTDDEHLFVVAVILPTLPPSRERQPRRSICSVCLVSFIMMNGSTQNFGAKEKQYLLLYWVEAMDTGTTY